MMQAAKNTIADGVPEYEIALSTSSAGTKKASELLNKYYPNSRMSPYIHFLQIMASGDHMPLTHHRASNKIINMETQYLFVFVVWQIFINLN